MKRILSSAAVHIRISESRAAGTSLECLETSKDILRPCCPGADSAVHHQRHVGHTDTVRGEDLFSLEALAGFIHLLTVVRLRPSGSNA